MNVDRRSALFVVALAFAIFAVAPSKAAARTPLVVVDIAIADASPVPDPEAVRASLAASGKTPRAWLAAHLEALGYTSLDEARIDAGLRGMGTSAAACGDSACAAQLGRALGAERAVFGKVIKVSSIVWVLEATLVDVASTRVLRREQLELKGDGPQLLPRAMLSMARRLAGADAGRSATPVP